MGTVVVFANQKGGVGKTTSAANIGAFAAESGKKILLIDFDPQGNLSSSIGADKDKPGVYELITHKAQFEEVVQDTCIDNLKIISSSINLTGANIELIDMDKREFFLKSSLEGKKEKYDYVFIDSPPALGILTVNGLVAANYVVIPLQCEYFALEGLSLLLQTIKRVQKNLNPLLELGGIFFTMYDSRTKLANEVVQEVTGYFKNKVFRTIIPRNVRLSEAPSHAVPINKYDPVCSGALNYKKLAEEVVKRV